jgi:hypothetical protein
MSFAATCLGLRKTSSSNYQLEEITTLHGLTRQYYHAITACHRVWEMYARTSITLLSCTAFTLCSLCVVFLLRRAHLPHATLVYCVHVVFLVRGYPTSGVCPLCISYFIKGDDEDVYIPRNLNVHLYFALTLLSRIFYKYEKRKQIKHKTAMETSACSHITSCNPMKWSTH